MMSLLIVSKLRQSEDFPVGHQVQTYLPTVEKKIVDGVEKKLSPIIKMINYLTNEVNQIILLVAGRWVGIEGVMAVYGNKDLNFSSFITSFNDEFDYSNFFMKIQLKEANLPIKKVLKFLLFLSQELSLFFFIQIP